MAITKDDAFVSPYKMLGPPSSPTGMLTFLEGELRRLENTVQQLAYLIPQVAIAEPTKKLTGMIRWNKAPWDPMGTGDGLVKWTGSAWAAV